jgi:hypothetical protein
MGLETGAVSSKPRHVMSRLKVRALSTKVRHVMSRPNRDEPQDLPTRLRADLVAASFVTESGAPDREAFAVVLARRGRMSHKVARNYSYRWTSLGKRAKRLSSKNAKLVARILKTDPARYLPPDAESELAAVRATLRDVQAELRRLEARLRTLEAR